MADVNLVTIFLTGASGGLVAGVFTVAGQGWQQRYGREEGAREWLRGAGYPALQRVLTAARQVDDWTFAVEFLRRLGREPDPEYLSRIRETTEELDAAMTEVELFLSHDLADLAAALAREASAVASEATTGTSSIAEAIRFTARGADNVREQRPLFARRKELLRAIQKELGLKTPKGRGRVRFLRRARKPPPGP